MNGLQRIEIRVWVATQTMAIKSRLKNDGWSTLRGVWQATNFYHASEEELVAICEYIKKARYNSNNNLASSINALLESIRACPFTGEMRTETIKCLVGNVYKFARVAPYEYR